LKLTISKVEKKNILFQCCVASWGQSAAMKINQQSNYQWHALLQLCSKVQVKNLLTMCSNDFLKSICAANNPQCKKFKLCGGKMPATIYLKINHCNKFKQKGFIFNNQPTLQTAKNLQW